MRTGGAAFKPVAAIPGRASGEPEPARQSRPPARYRARNRSKLALAPLISASRMASICSSVGVWP